MHSSHLNDRYRRLLIVIVFGYSATSSRKITRGLKSCLWNLMTKRLVKLDYSSETYVTQASLVDLIHLKGSAMISN